MGEGKLSPFFMLDEIAHNWMEDWSPGFTDALFSEQRRLTHAKPFIDAYHSFFWAAFCGA